jgi:hypothetical protein
MSFGQPKPGGRGMTTGARSEFHALRHNQAAQSGQFMLLFELAL